MTPAVVAIIVGVLGLAGTLLATWMGNSHQRKLKMLEAVDHREQWLEEEHRKAVWSLVRMLAQARASVESPRPERITTSQEVLKHQMQASVLGGDEFRLTAEHARELIIDALGEDDSQERALRCRDFDSYWSRFVEAARAELAIVAERDELDTVMAEYGRKARAQLAQELRDGLPTVRKVLLLRQPRRQDTPLIDPHTARNPKQLSADFRQAEQSEPDRHSQLKSDLID